jgi:hypothetical protein
MKEKTYIGMDLGAKLTEGLWWINGATTDGTQFTAGFFDRDINRVGRQRGDIAWECAFTDLLLNLFAEF